MLKALAYLNFGRWVVDCTAGGCTDAREVYDPQSGARLAEDTCARGHHFQIEMPPPQLEAQIVAAVQDRVNDADKAWYPQGHTRALLTGQPTGQSVADLVDENREVAAYRQAQDNSRHEQLQEVLGRLGVEVRPDGTFEGSL